MKHDHPGLKHVRFDYNQVRADIGHARSVFGPVRLGFKQTHLDDGSLLIHKFLNDSSQHNHVFLSVFFILCIHCEHVIFEIITLSITAFRNNECRFLYITFTNTSIYISTSTIVSIQGRWLEG